METCFFRCILSVHLSRCVISSHIRGCCIIKNLSGLCSRFLGQRFLSLWNLLNHRISIIHMSPVGQAWFYANEVTQWNTGQFWDGSGHARKLNYMISRFRIWAGWFLSNQEEREEAGDGIQSCGQWFISNQANDFWSLINFINIYLKTLSDKLSWSGRKGVGNKDGG